jgi:hypothetical protein
MNGVVYDSLNNEKLPFVSIYKKRDRKGTRSGFDGTYALENVQSGDTIFCSNIGYEKHFFIAKKAPADQVIYLKLEAQTIEEVTVLADMSVLYEMISNVKKTVSKAKHSAKTYFELESFHDESQLELFQGYYNGTFQGYNAAALEMKTGRFALAPIEKRIFASTETSEAMYLHELLESNEFFPTSPFELSKRRLRANYKLLLNTKYVDPKGKTIYVIRFDPVETNELYFSGNVWIDSVSNQIQKVILEIDDAKLHPFASIWPDHALEDVSMQITKSFEEFNGEMVMSSTDFDYSLKYLSKHDSETNITTRAVLYAYNFEDLFQLPFFDFPDVSNSDYHRIQMLPYNDQFWECQDEFKLANNEERSSFMKEEATIKVYELFSSDSLLTYNFFESPYVTWNGNRILIKGLTEDSSLYYDKSRALYSDMYNLEVQLFTEINELCDSVEVFTKTIFDPYTSYYHFETTKESQAFLNIYFDLVEIERRKLAEKLARVKTDPKAVKQLHDEARNKLDLLRKRYFKEVQRGTNKEALLKWNDIVQLELEIDNLCLFDVQL